MTKGTKTIRKLTRIAPTTLVAFSCCGYELSYEAMTLTFERDLKVSR